MFLGIKSMKADGFKKLKSCNIQIQTKLLFNKHPVCCYCMIDQIDKIDTRDLIGFKDHIKGQKHISSKNYLILKHYMIGHNQHPHLSEETLIKNSSWTLQVK